jgi:hypothetical protein
MSHEANMICITIERLEVALNRTNELLENQIALLTQQNVLLEKMNTKEGSKPLSELFREHEKKGL